MLDFLAYLEFERGLSRNTLEAYRSDLLQFGAYLRRRASTRSRSTHADLAGVPRRRSRRASDDRPPVAPATLQRKVACLRSFYRHLRREGIIEHDPTADLRAPAPEPQLPAGAHAATRSPGCSSSRRAPSPPALRDRALLELMYACGLRASEAIDLEVGDVDLEAGVLRARGKGSKERLVPVGSRRRSRAVRAYLEPRPPARSSATARRARLFVNHRGSGLTRQGLYKIVQRHAARGRARRTA